MSRRLRANSSLESARSFASSRSKRTRGFRSKSAEAIAPLYRKALAAATGALGVGVGEDEAGGKVVFLPVHRRADQVEYAATVDVEGAAGRLDLLVERLLLGHVVDRVGEARAATPRGRQPDSDRVIGRLGHQIGDARLRGGCQDDSGGTLAKFALAHHSIPSSRRASSLILAGSHGGSHTRLTSASRTPRTEEMRSSTSAGIDSATGQCGVVRVIVTATSASGLTSTP